MCVSATGLSVAVYGLSVSICGLSVINFPESRTQLVEVTDWPGNFTGLSGTVTERPAKVTDCNVTLPFFCLSSCTVGKSIFGTSGILGTDKPVSLTDKPESVTDRPLS